MDLAKLSADLKRDEGLRLQAYLDTASNLSIGYGHNLTAKGITQTQAEWLLHDDLIETLADLDSRLPWSSSLDEVRQRALANMAYNLGIDGLLKFHKMLDALQAGEFERAAAEALDSVWATQVGDRATRLAEMLRTGQDPS